MGPCDAISLRLLTGGVVLWILMQGSFMLKQQPSNVQALPDSPVWKHTLRVS